MKGVTPHLPTPQLLIVFPPTYLHMSLPELYHTVPEPALLLFITVSIQSGLRSIYSTHFILIFLFPNTVTPLHCSAIFFSSSPPSIFLFVFCSLHSFFSTLLPLMSVAMARSIQDGVFVLSAERKMNVAAMHPPHTPPVSVWECVSSVFGWHLCLFTSHHVLIAVALVLNWDPRVRK